MNLPPAQSDADLLPVRRRPLFCLLMALLGGLFAIFGAVLKEASSGVFLVPFLIAPAIEEVLKPAGVYYLLEKKPQALSNRAQLVVLCGLGGLVFATIENLVYLNLYLPDPDPGIVLWRYSICTLLHVGCSLVVGLGISKQLCAVRDEGKTFELEQAMPYLVAAIALHALYNTTVYFLEFSGFRPW